MTDPYIQLVQIHSSWTC